MCEISLFIRGLSDAFGVHRGFARLFWGFFLGCTRFNAYPTRGPRVLSHANTAFLAGVKKVTWHVYGLSVGFVAAGPTIIVQWNIALLVGPTLGSGCFAVAFFIG